MGAGPGAAGGQPHRPASRAAGPTRASASTWSPVNADAPDVDVEFVEVEDRLVNPLGVKGVGEIGQVGAAAAIANAVHHATGRRVRELPITIEHLL